MAKLVTILESKPDSVTSSQTAATAVEILPTKALLPFQGLLGGVEGGYSAPALIRRSKKYKVFYSSL